VDKLVIRRVSALESNGARALHSRVLGSGNNASAGVVVDFSVVIPEGSATSSATSSVSAKLQSLSAADPSDASSPLAVLVQAVTAEIQKEGGVVPAEFSMVLSAPVTTEAASTSTSVPTSVPVSIAVPTAYPTSTYAPVDTRAEQEDSTVLVVVIVMLALVIGGLSVFLAYTATVWWKVDHTKKRVSPSDDTDDLSNIPMEEAVPSPSPSPPSDDPLPGTGVGPPLSKRSVNVDETAERVSDATSDVCKSNVGTSGVTNKLADHKCPNSSDKPGHPPSMTLLPGEVSE
jgi:hypothetical protein